MENKIRIDYVIFHTSSIKKRNDWWKQCDQDVTYVKAIKKRKYYYVECDLIASGFRVSEQGQTLIRRMWDDEHNLLEQTNFPKSKRYITTDGPTIPSSEIVLPERVEYVCKKLCRLIKDYSITEEEFKKLNKK